MKFAVKYSAHLVAIVVFLSSLNGHCTEKVKATAPKAATPKTFNLKVVYGDKTSEFSLTGNSPDKKSEINKAGILKFSSNGQIKQRDVAEKDLNFLFSEIKKIKGSNQQHLCDDRGYIEVVNGENKTIGCLGSTTKVAKQLTSMANLLTAMIK